MEYTSPYTPDHDHPLGCRRESRRHVKKAQSSLSLYNRCSSVSLLLTTGRLHLFFNVVEDRIRLFNLLLRLGFDYLTQAIAKPIKNLGHRTGRRQLLLAIPLLSESL